MIVWSGAHAEVSVWVARTFQAATPWLPSLHTRARALAVSLLANRHLFGGECLPSRRGYHAVGPCPTATAVCTIKILKKRREEKRGDGVPGGVGLPCFLLRCPRRSATRLRSADAPTLEIKIVYIQNWPQPGKAMLISGNGLTHGYINCTSCPYFYDHLQVSSAGFRIS